MCNSVRKLRLRYVLHSQKVAEIGSAQGFRNCGTDSFKILGVYACILPGDLFIPKKKKIPLRNFETCNGVYSDKFMLGTKKR